MPEPPKILVAKVSILAPFDWARGSEDGSLAEAAAAFDVRPSGLGDAPMWSRTRPDPARRELETLDPAIRELLDGRVRQGDRHGMIRYELNSELSSNLFASPRLSDGPAGTCELAAVEGVELYLFASGHGFVAINVRCADPGAQPLAWLLRPMFLLRHSRMSGDRATWSFQTRPDIVAKSALPAALTAPAHLNAWIAWLVGAEDLAEALPHYLPLHSVVVLDREPDDVHATLFLLRRAADAQYAPPPTIVPPDQAIQVRGNRCFGLSREGTVSLSWLLPGASSQFETQQWPPKFMGIYRRLVILARAERLGLTALANEVTRLAPRLARHDLPDPDLRREIERMSMRLIQASLGMAEGDCGGVSEYTLIFESARQVLGVPGLRQEVLAEAHTFLELVENAHREATDGEERRFQRLIGLLGAVAVPFGVVGAMAGVNKFGDLWPEGILFTLASLAIGGGAVWLARKRGLLPGPATPPPRRIAGQTEKPRRELKGK